MKLRVGTEFKIGGGEFLIGKITKINNKFLEDNPDNDRIHYRFTENRVTRTRLHFRTRLDFLTQIRDGRYEIIK